MTTSPRPTPLPRVRASVAAAAAWFFATGLALAPRDLLTPTTHTCTCATPRG
ncbi:hypothetical protein ACN20G_26655 (plasmid) [Streptomyces sp. BI20]|uniref:hypothetical protein n=1 Tax=Streptomyces sp. BI20 TaxID=3403460 RepID=UPI003C78D885